jgi:hypothetical protein
MSETQGLEGPMGARFIVPLRFLTAVAMLLAAVFLAAPPNIAESPGASGMALRRAQHLRHGIKLSEWFAQVYDAKGYTKEHFESWNTAPEIALIKARGSDHVRLSVNLQPMFRRKQADQISADYLGYLDAAIKVILDQGLAVMTDAHPDSEFKEKLATENDFVEEFADFWLEAAAGVPDPVKRLQVARYGMDQWNAARRDAEFDQVSAWAKQWNIVLICNELGAYRKAAWPEDRAAWISDVGKSLGKHGIG